MQFIVINTCYGGFGLSNEAIERYAELKGIKLYCKKGALNEYYTSPDFTNESYFSYYDIPRDSNELVTVVEELGKKANTQYAKLKIVKIPNDVKWEIKEYDGYEWIAEIHRVWR